MNKRLFRLNIFVGYIIGGWLGSLVAYGNWFAWQSIIGGLIGLGLGILITFKWLQS
jgi:hypothetical protein